MGDVFDEIESGTAVDVFDEVAPETQDIFDEIEFEGEPAVPKLQPPEPAPIAPTFEAPVSITEQGPVYGKLPSIPSTEPVPFFPSSATIKEPSALVMPPTGELSTTYGGPRKPLASYAETMASVGEGAETPMMRLAAPRPQITEPRIETPKIPIPKEAGFGEALASEMVNSVLSVPDFFTSDLGIASLLAAKLSPRVVSSAFALDLSKSAVQQAIDTYKNWDTMSPADKGKAVAGTAMSLLFGGVAGAHAIRGPKAPVLTQAPPVFGDVLRPPAERGVPTSLGIERPEGVSSVQPKPAAPAEAAVSIEAMQERGSVVGAEHYGRSSGKDMFRFTDPTAEPGKPSQITFTVPEGATREQVAEARKLALARARVGEGIPEENVQISVNNLGPEFPGKGFVQVDEVNHPRAGNVFSANPEIMKKAGLDMPSSNELLTLPNGKYTLPEAKRLLAEKKAPQASAPAVAVPKTTLVFHGEGGEGGVAGKGGAWYTTDFNKALSYGGEISFLRLTPEEAARFRQPIKTDYVVDAETLKRSQKIDRKFKQPVQELEVEETAAKTPVTAEKGVIPSEEKRQKEGVQEVVSVPTEKGAEPTPPTPAVSKATEEAVSLAQSLDPLNMGALIGSFQKAHKAGYSGREAQSAAWSLYQAMRDDSVRQSFSKASDWFSGTKRIEILLREASAGLKALAVGEVEKPGPITRSGPPPPKGEEGARETATPTAPTPAQSVKRVPDNGRVEYRVPATGKRKQFIKWNGQWFKSKNGVRTGKPIDPEIGLTRALEAQLAKESQQPTPPAAGEKGMGAAVPPLSVGPGASSPAEFTQRQAGANRRPPPSNPPVTTEPGQSPTPEVVRQSKDYHLFNRINSGQWLFYFGRLGEAAKQAFEKSALAEFFMRESVMRDVKTFVRGTLKELPRSARKQGGKAFFDVLDGKTMDQIRSEWEGKPNGESIIAQAEKVKTRLEEIRTTIRDIKRDSFNRYLNAMNKDALVDLFRENINKEIEIGKMTKEDLANALTMDQFPDDWGISDGSYLPHLFFGQWRVTVKMPGAEGSQFVTRSQTIQEAKARIYEQTKSNPELKDAQFTIEQDTVVPADMIRLGDRRFWNLVSKMREQNMTQAEVKDALRGNIGRKAGKEKWFGSTKQRMGFGGYSKDYARTMTAYLNGFHRWKVLTELNREVQPLIEQVRGEGRHNAAQRLEQILDNLWGKPHAATKQFDAFVRQIPGVRDFIKPMALDRWARAATNLTGLLTLRTLRFSAVNRLQPLQTLYPMIGERGIIEAKIMQHTDQGRDLLREAGVDLDPGQYAGEFGTGLRGREFTERFSGERSNQEVAFLGMYNHARKMGLSHQDAINYGKLRGQLMTQFTPLTVDAPELFEGPFGRLMFQYKRFPVKTIELTSQMAADRNLPGIARIVAVLATLGGISYFLRQTWASDPDTRLRIKRGLDKELGTKAADTLMYGLPGFLGADISGSITLGDEPIGRGIYEKGARALTGPAISLGIETARTLTTPKRKKTTGIQQAETILRKYPATRPLAELSAMLRGDLDIRTPDGETKLRRKLTDAIAGLGSFRSANEANISLAVNGIMTLAKEEARLKNEWYTAKDKTAVRKDIVSFNRIWPEAAITAEDLRRYGKYRDTAGKQTDVSKIAGKRFEKLIPKEQRARK